MQTTIWHETPCLPNLRWRVRCPISPSVHKAAKFGSGFIKILRFGGGNSCDVPRQNHGILDTVVGCHIAGFPRQVPYQLYQGFWSPSSEGESRTRWRRESVSTFDPGSVKGREQPIQLTSACTARHSMPLTHCPFAQTFDGDEPQRRLALPTNQQLTPAFRATFLEDTVASWRGETGAAAAAKPTPPPLPPQRAMPPLDRAASSLRPRNGTEAPGWTPKRHGRGRRGSATAGWCRRGPGLFLCPAPQQQAGDKPKPRTPSSAAPAPNRLLQGLGWAGLLLAGSPGVSSASEAASAVGPSAAGNFVTLGVALLLPALCIPAEERDATARGLSTAAFSLMFAPRPDPPSPPCPSWPSNSPSP